MVHVVHAVHVVHVKFRPDRSVRRSTRRVSQNYEPLEQPSGWYWAEIAPPRNESTDIDLSYARFLPRTRFGEPIAGDSCSGQTVGAIGVLISNKRAENSALEIDSISVGEESSVGEELEREWLSSQLCDVRLG